MASLATIRELLSLAIARLEKADPHDTIDAIATQIHTAAHMCRQFARLEKVVEPGGHRVLYSPELAQAERLLREAIETMANDRRAAVNKLAKAQQWIDAAATQR
jgi:hypothetical protein